MSDLMSAKQMLRLDDTLFPEVLDRSIKGTIRIGERAIVDGKMVLVSTRGGYLPLLVDVVDHGVKTFGEITEADAQRIGASSVEAAKAQLRVFYPEIKDDTPVTTIGFERA